MNPVFTVSVTRYYNSRFDVARAINASYPTDLNRTDWYDYVTVQAKELASVSTLLARYLYQEATGKSAPSSLTANSSTVSTCLKKF